MDLPPPSTKRQRVARNLSNIPLELVEPILKELPLHRVMELAFISPPQAGVRAAVASSPSWRFFFGNRMEFAERIWHSLNRLSWLWCRQPWMQTINRIAYPLGSYFHESTSPLEQDSRSRTPRHNDLENLFLMSFQTFLTSSDWMCGVQQHQLQAICLFLPQELLRDLAKGDLSYLREPRNFEQLSDNHQDYLQSPVDEIALRDVFATAIVRHGWTADDAHVFLLYLSHAYRLLCQARSAELSFLADLYERFPSQLKLPLAPQTPRRNTKHIADALRRDSHSALGRPLRSPGALYGRTDFDPRDSGGDLTDATLMEWGENVGREALFPVLVESQATNDVEMEDAPGIGVEGAGRLDADRGDGTWMVSTDDPNTTTAATRPITSDQSSWTRGASDWEVELDSDTMEDDDGGGRRGPVDPRGWDATLEQRGREYQARLARKARKPPTRTFHGWFRFRYPYGALVPYDWCLRLFLLVLEKHPLPQGADRYPPELLADVQCARSGLEFIYQHGDAPDRIRLPRFSTTKSRKLASFNWYRGSSSELPKPPAELEWLRSFTTVVSWMTGAFPELTASVQSMTPKADSGTVVRWSRTRKSMTRSDYELFISQKPASVIAAQLQRDSEACNTGSEWRPSPLALFMPPWSKPRAKVIAKHLSPSPHLQLDALQLVYECMLVKIKAYLRLAPQAARPAQAPLVHETMGAAARGGDASTTGDEASSEIDPADLETAARILQKLLRKPEVPVTVSVSDAVLEAVRLMDLNSSAAGAAPPEITGKAQEYWEKSVAHLQGARLGRSPAGRNPRSVTCYICRLQTTEAHKAFASMCVPCGNFNLAGSNFSTPDNLRLEGRTALVTGGRVNLGYHVALRLLRCGANVIVSTRYPRDALERYRAEPDSFDWTGRLRIVGADFRAARDAFNLVEQVVPIVDQWGGRLHILINNAAQTLTDSIGREEQAIQREKQLLDSSPAGMPALVEHSYQPRVRGGAVGSLEGPSTRLLSSFPPRDPRTLSPYQQPDAPQGSSWVQSLGQIPYEDIISAHSVNAFVPLILLRELLPLLARGKRPGGTYSSDQWPPPRAHVVNVSSREGIFEHNVSTSSAKNARHVHTNMSKAALNMITETEAAVAWHDYRVAINTVDPGYMSAAPEMRNSNPPLDWEDGAGRVLWPVAMGEMAKREDGSGGIVYGRFLKHYGAVQVEPGLGRLCY